MTHRRSITLFIQYVTFTRMKYGIIRNLKRWQWLILNWIVIFILLPPILGDFIFCHSDQGGLHRLKETDCRGGFIAFSPLNTSCMYYAYRKGSGIEVPDLAVSITDDICGSKPEKSVQLNGKTDLSIFNKFHAIFFHRLTDLYDKERGVEIPEEICTADCLGEWRDFTQDPTTEKPTEEPIVIEQPNITESQREKQEKANMKLLTELFIVLSRNNDLFDDVTEEDTIFRIANFLQGNSTQSVADIKGLFNIIRLLIQSVKIAIVKCDPAIEPNFYAQVVQAMIFLHRKSPKYPVVEIHSKPYKKIIKLLEDCQASAAAGGGGWRIEVSTCDGTHKIIEVHNSRGFWKYMRLSTSFAWGEYDPIVEAAWAAVDFVHGFCFETFYKAQALLHFNLYIEAMRALFPTEPVLKLWMYPVKLKNDFVFWNSIMDTNDIKIQMRNIDACAIAAHWDSNFNPFIKRLPRPFVKEKENQTTVTTTPKPIPPEPSSESSEEIVEQGWQGTIKEYWKWYEEKGGFLTLSKQFGACIEGWEDRKNSDTFELEKSLRCSK